MKKMKKVYCLDTNVLLSDPNSLVSFDEHDVIIPMIVLEELDNHKSRQDEVGKNARHVSRFLDELRTAESDLSKGVKLTTGGTLKIARIMPEDMSLLPVELRAPKVDNMIIAFMQSFLKSLGSSDDTQVILVSKDINVRVKCDSLGIQCEDYRKMRVSVEREQFYRGVEVVQVTPAVIDKFFLAKELKTTDLVDKKLYPNQIVVLKSVTETGSTKSALTRVVDNTLIRLNEYEHIFGLEARNKEQAFSFDLLMDPDIKLLTLVGPAGCGKTLMAIAAGLSQVRGIANDPSLIRYEKLIVTKPVQPVGKDIGFLPGTLQEKMEPWISPIRDNLDFLMTSRKRKGRRNTNKPDDSMLGLLQQQGVIEIEAITFIRGRSIPNAFVIIDEAQNLSMHELKTIITRVGDGTKIVLTGDIEQIDNVHVDVYTNGLTYAVEKFKEHDIAGHVTLLKGERSALATLAAKIL